MRALTAAVIVSIIGFVGEPVGNSEPQRPNILLIVSDDVGYADIGVYGSREIPTPHIDRIARSPSRLGAAIRTRSSRRVASEPVRAQCPTQPDTAARWLNAVERL